MKLRHIIGSIGLVGAAPLLAGTAFAQAAAPAPAAAATVQVTAGATVYGPDGNEVGKVEKVEGGNAVINTGKNSAAVPASAFGKNDKGLIVSMTRDQLDAAVAAASAKAAGNLDQALVAGADVHTSDGQALGKIASVSPEGLVTVQRESGSFALKKDMFTTDAQGVALRLTLAQIEAAISKQQASAGTPAAHP
jgi:hypothetical protein